MAENGSPNTGCGSNWPESGAEDAEAARRTDNGAVVFEGTDTQASTAVQATEDGGVRFMTVTSGSDAPEDYRFDMDLPAGAQILGTEDGGFIVVDGQGNFLQTIEAPWAKDANGQDVAVSYRLEGSTIVMHVQHAGRRIPWWRTPGGSLGPGPRTGASGAASSGAAVVDRRGERRLDRCRLRSPWGLRRPRDLALLELGEEGRTANEPASEVNGSRHQLHHLPLVAMVGVKLLPEPWSTWWPLAAGVISLAVVSVVARSRSSR